MKESFKKIIEILSEHYSIQPIIPKTATFIFILESPHVHELKHQAPVAGSSGKTMASTLLGESFNKPLGLLIKENIASGFKSKRLNKIGIMNVSNIPLQRKAYENPTLIQRYDTFFNLLEKLRTTNQKTTYTSAEMMELQQVLLMWFNQQLETLVDWNCTIVPCGRFAQKFYHLSTVRGDGWKVIYDVPHPSYNSWNQAKYKQKIEELQLAFMNS